MITVTNKAINKIDTLISVNYPFLRISVQGGGCSGFQYSFQLDDVENKEDTVLGKLVIIDPISLMYLDGSEIDYEENLSGSFFNIKNPQAVSTCGCGSSFGV